MKINSYARLRIGLADVIYVYLAMLPIVWMTDKIVQFAIQLLVCLVYVLTVKVKIKKSLIPIIIYIVAHCVSILLNFQSENDYSRIIAALNTVMCWVLGAMIFSYIGEIKIKKTTIQKLCSYLLYVIIIISVIALIASKIGIKPFQLSGQYLYVTEWFNGQNRMRSNCFMEYANLVPYACFLLFPFAYDNIKKNKTINRIIFLLLIIIPLYVSNSRLGILLIGILLIVEAFKTLRRRKNSRLILFIIVILFALFAFFNYQRIIELIRYVFDNLINGRSGSNTTRLKLYDLTFERYKNSSLVFGVGIKTISSELPDIPLGSHSTYLGALYKSGIVGLIALICFFTYLAKRIYYLCKKELIDKLYLFSLLGFLTMMVLEDIDGANWAIFLFFICMAFTMNIGINPHLQSVGK